MFSFFPKQYLHYALHKQFYHHTNKNTWWGSNMLAVSQSQLLWKQWLAKSGKELWIVLSPRMFSSMAFNQGCLISVTRWHSCSWTDFVFKVTVLIYRDSHFVMIILGKQYYYLYLFFNYRSIQTFSCFPLHNKKLSNFTTHKRGTKNLTCKFCQHSQVWVPYCHHGDGDSQTWKAATHETGHQTAGK